MATVSILPISDPKGEKSYRALAGDKHSEGKTAGQALDVLTAQLGEIEFSAIVLIQSFQPDSLLKLSSVNARTICRIQVVSSSAIKYL